MSEKGNETKVGVVGDHEKMLALLVDLRLKAEHSRDARRASAETARSTTPEDARAAAVMATRMTGRKHTPSTAAELADDARRDDHIASKSDEEARLLGLIEAALRTKLGGSPDAEG